VSFSGKEEAHVEDIEDDDGDDHHSSIQTVLELL
jgi:hypothetical protein